MIRSDLMRIPIVDTRVKCQDETLYTIVQECSVARV